MRAATAASSLNIAAAEIMECVGGCYQVRLKGETKWKKYTAGQSSNHHHQCSAKLKFEIEVTGEPFHYICHYA